MTDSNKAIDAFLIFLRIWEFYYKAISLSVKDYPSKKPGIGTLQVLIQRNIRSDSTEIARIFRCFIIQGFYNENVISQYRKICYVLVVLWVFCYCSAWAQLELPGDTPLGLYESKYYAVYVPLDWVVTPMLDGLGREKFSPPEGSQEQGDFRFDVVVMKFPATLEEYYTAITNQDADNMKKASLSRDQIGTTPAFHLNYTKKVDKNNYQVTRIIAIENGIVYDLGFTILADKAPKYQKLMKAMSASFEIRSEPSP